MAETVVFRIMANTRKNVACKANWKQARLDWVAVRFGRDLAAIILDGVETEYESREKEATELFEEEGRLGAEDWFLDPDEHERQFYYMSTKEELAKFHMLSREGWLGRDDAWVARALALRERQFVAVEAYDTAKARVSRRPLRPY